MKNKEDALKTPVSKEEYEKAKSTLSKTDFKKQYFLQAGSGPSDPDKYYSINVPKPKEVESMISADILKELRELKKAQTDGNRHLKTLKFIGWFFVGATAVALVFLIKFTIALTGFMDNLTISINNFTDNMAVFNGFVDNLSVNLTEFVANLAALNDFISNLNNLFS
jgi:hypothetical protein